MEHFCRDTRKTWVGAVGCAPTLYPDMVNGVVASPLLSLTWSIIGGDRSLIAAEDQLEAPRDVQGNS